MSFYRKFSDNDLTEAYSSMINYSGKANADLLNEIDYRGGMDKFLKQIEKAKVAETEIKRVTEEVYSLSSPDTNIEFIRQTIGSDILSQDQLDFLIERKFDAHQAMLADTSIGTSTIIGSLVGGAIGSLISGILFGLSIIYFDRIFFFLLVIVYIICYSIIKLVTKQSRNNLAVFIASFLATVGAAVIGLLIARLLKE